MRTLSTFLFVLLFSSSFVLAQNAKDLSQKPVSFNNPLSVSGPALDAPLAAFYESFEGVTFPPAGWVKYSPDAGTGWERITAGTTPLPGWTGGTAIPAPVAGSGTGMAYATYTTGGASSNDQWLVTPQIMNVQSGDSLKFWIRVFSTLYADEVQVKISTTGNAIANFTTTVANLVYAAADTGWYSYSYKLGDFVPNGSNIYVAFREIVADNIGDGDAIFLDEVSIVSGVNPNTFFDTFDSYTAGQLVACQNPVDWTTWSNAPCGAEDAEVSNAFAWSGSNSAKIISADDFVKPLGNKTTGKWYMSFLYYVPATKTGYFNTMNVFTLPSTFTWGMDVYFDAGGAGRIDTTGGGGVPANTVNFTWSVGLWNQAIVIVDLDTQIAEFWTGTNPVNLTQIATWNWTQGGTKPNTLAVQDFYGAAATNELYIDDYFFSDEMPTVVPVELSAFSAFISNGAVVLNWTTETELNNQGFQVERRTVEGQFVTIGSVQGNGTTTERKQYSYTDAGVETGNYYYRLKQIDFDGTYEYSNEIFVDVTAPLEFALDQNYPNPFNPTTTINFSLAEPTFVKLAIYNLLGEEVEVLKNEYMNAGSFNVSFDASSLPSGMYLYKVETAQFSSVRKMMLMK